VIRQEAALGEVGREESLDHGLLLGCPACSLGHPVCVERAAQLDALEIEHHANLPAETGKALVAGMDLFGTHAVLGGQNLFHGLRALGGCPGVQLERPVDDSDLVGVLELFLGRVQSIDPEGAPRAGEIRPDVKLHNG